MKQKLIWFGIVFLSGFVCGTLTELIFIYNR